MVYIYVIGKSNCFLPTLQKLTLYIAKIDLNSAEWANRGALVLWALACGLKFRLVWAFVPFGVGLVWGEGLALAVGDL